MPNAGDKRSRSGIWILAACLSLLVHVGAIIGVRSLGLATPAPAAAVAERPIELVFMPEPETADSPNTFTELPDDRQDEAPERADFLSNVQSRARDLIPGAGTSRLPGSDGLSEAPHLAMRPGSAAGLAELRRSDELATEPQPEPATEEEREADSEETSRKPEDSPQSGYLSLSDEIAAVLEAQRAEETIADPLVNFRRREPERESPQPVAFGQGDYYQEALANPGGNVSLIGDISMNTTAWINGFWMQRFQRDVSAMWVAPYAFGLGIIHGWTSVELEVDRSGELLRLVVLDESGHYTLKDASVRAIRDAAPFMALPDEFPEETFTVQLKMIYADYSRRRSGEQP